MLNWQPAPKRRAPPGFIDLRSFARDASQGVAFGNWATEDAFLSSRRALAFPSGPATAGVIVLAAGSGAVASMPADEFIIACEGFITLAQEGRKLTLEEGGCAVIRHGAALTWSAPRPVTLVFMRYNNSWPGDGAIVPMAENPDMGPSGGPLAELLLTPAPVCRNHIDYQSADQAFVCGTWDATPYRRRPMAYHMAELMYLLEGSVTLADETGRARTFARGDIVIIEQHAQCSWESREHVAKVYATCRAA